MLAGHALVGDRARKEGKRKGKRFVYVFLKTRGVVGLFVGLLGGRGWFGEGKGMETGGFFERLGLG